MRSPKTNTRTMNGKATIATHKKKTSRAAMADTSVLFAGSRFSSRPPTSPGPAILPCINLSQPPCRSGNNTVSQACPLGAMFARCLSPASPTSASTVRTTLFAQHASVAPKFAASTQSSTHFSRLRFRGTPPSRDLKAVFLTLACPAMAASLSSTASASSVWIVKTLTYAINVSPPPPNAHSTRLTTTSSPYHPQKSLIGTPIPLHCSCYPRLSSLSIATAVARTSIFLCATNVSTALALIFA